MSKSITQSKLDRLRRKWQKLLRLQDWKIKIGTAKLDFLKEITGIENPIGACEHFVEAKQAKIWILAPSDWGEEPNDRTQDIEDTVVHELLHCHLAAITPEDQGTKLLIEQAIEVLTEVLVVLGRGKSGRSGG